MQDFFRRFISSTVRSEDWSTTIAAFYKYMTRPDPSYVSAVVFPSSNAIA